MRQPRRAPRTVDDEVRAALGSLYDHPGHPSTGHGDPVDDHPVLQPDGRQRRDVSPDHVLQQRPGHAEKSAAPVSLRPVASALKDPGTSSVGRGSTPQLELLLDAGEPPDEPVQPRAEQQVDVAALRDVPARRDRVGESLPFEHDDLVDNVGQDPSGQKARDAGTHDDDRVMVRVWPTARRGCLPTAKPGGHVTCVTSDQTASATTAGTPSQRQNDRNPGGPAAGQSRRQLVR